MIDAFPIYLALALTVTVIPGPAVAMAVSSSLRYGVRGALAGIFGHVVAMVTLATLSACGLGVLLSSSRSLLIVLQVAGGLYLVYLGLSAWFSPPHQPDATAYAGSGSPRTTQVLFRQGIGVGLGNPKAIAFFTALFPQFINPDRAYLPQFLTLIATIETLSCLVLAAYAVVAVQVAGRLFSDRVQHRFRRLTGLSFIGFAIALLFEIRA